MLNTHSHPKLIEEMFYAFVIIHIIAWTAAPAWVRFNLPLDAMEGTTWGHQLEWGYDKNPFMNGWLTALATQLGSSGWATYLFSQISVGVGFWAIWRLANKMLSPAYALIAVLMLEGVQYYNLHAIDFNDNTLEIGFWALTIFYFYQALREPSHRHWILTGLFAGCSMMTKYYAGVLFVPMALLVLLYSENRSQLKKSPIYTGIITFLLIVLPHFIWLSFHDWITIQYAFDRVSSPPTLWNHFFNPMQFAWQQLETFIPVIILTFLLLLFSQQKTREDLLENSTASLSLFDKRFLFYIGLGPFLLTVLLSAVTGMTLRAAWGQPLLSLWGIILVSCLKSFLKPYHYQRFFILTLFVLFLIVGGYCTALIRADAPSSANYPGEKIAANLTQRWHEKYHTSLPYVAGSRWLAGNIAFYSSDKPSVYMNWDAKRSSWINEEQLKKTGALFVWDLTQDDEIPFEVIKKRFPTISTPKTFQFAWLRNEKMSPVGVQVAYLPPKK